MLMTRGHDDVDLDEADAFAEDVVRPRRLRLNRLGWFVLLVCLPALLIFLYLFNVARPQYRSEAQFVIKGMQIEMPQPGGLAQLLGSGLSLSGAQKEAQSIREFLLSRDAVAALRERGIDIISVREREKSDFFKRLWLSDPSAEAVTDFYRDRVNVTHSLDDNITRVSVDATDPVLAQSISEALIAIGETKVNAFNQRAIQASTELAQSDFASAERELALSEARMTGFRDLAADIDPAKRGEGIQRQVSEQEAMLTAHRALLADMRHYLSESSPQVVGMASRVRELEAALTKTKTRLTGTPVAQSKKLGQFEELKLKQGFAAKRYEAARQSIEQAREQAAKQRLFFVPVVRPGLPERAIWPRPFLMGLEAFLALSIAFLIGWLLIAGVREHRIT